MTNSPYNDHTLAPNPQFEERATVVYDEVIGQNIPRQGVSARQFEEGLAKGSNLAEFMGGMASSRVARGDLTEAPRRVYEVVRAGQETRRVEPGASNPSPAWAKEPAILDSMFWGSSGDQGDYTPFPFAARPGHNSQTITRLDGLDLGERRGTVYNFKIADNPRRRNEASI